MFNRHHLRLVVAGAALAGGSVALLANSASALVTETDNVKITSNGYDLGGAGFTGGVPDDPATLSWDHAWFGVVPTLTGKIHFEGVSGECARVRLISYDENGSALGSDYSDRKCANTNGHNVRAIEEGGNNLLGRPGAASVRVVLQHETANGWIKVGAHRDRTYGPLVDTDDVLISRAEVDFGSGPLVGGAPSDPGTVTWNATGTALDPVVTGTLYATNADDLTVRMRARYLEADGTVIETRYGIQHPITNDDPHEFSVNMNDFDGGGTAFGRNSVAKVKVSVQKSPTGSNVWETVGTMTVTLN
jgi:hypothetical protein